MAALLKEGRIGVAEMNGINENGTLLCGKDAVHELDVLPGDVCRALNNQYTAVLGSRTVGILRSFLFRVEIAQTPRQGSRKTDVP